MWEPRRSLQARGARKLSPASITLSSRELSLGNLTSEKNMSWRVPSITVKSSFKSKKSLWKRNVNVGVLWTLLHAGRFAAHLPHDRHSDAQPCEFLQIRAFKLQKGLLWLLNHSSSWSRTRKTVEWGMAKSRSATRVTPLVVERTFLPLLKFCDRSRGLRLPSQRTWQEHGHRFAGRLFTSSPPNGPESWFCKVES